MASMLEACRANQGLPAKLTAGSRVGYDLSKVGAGASRGFNGKKKLEAVPWSNTWPAPGATLDLDFANNRGFMRGLGQGGVMDGITFTRASAGWYVDQSGLLVEVANNVPRFDWANTTAVARRNQATSTEAFLPISGFTVTADATTAPNGTVSADKIIPTTDFGSHYISGTATIPGGVYTLSVYAKKAEYSGLRIIARNATARYAIYRFDLDTGVFSGVTNLSTVPGLISSSVDDAGDGWYRCRVTIDNTNTGFSYNLYFGATETSSETARDYSGDGVSGIFIWGSQMEVGETLTDYQAVGTQAPTITPLVPATTCNGLLIEEARTNRLLWCRDATQSNWVKTDITAAKDQTGIDGVANAASSLTATAAGGTCIQTITLASNSRAGSVFLKRLTGTGIVQVSLDGTTWSTVELSDTEWRRIVLSGTVTNPMVGIKLATSGDAVAMDFGQVEDGGFATTPILTTGASTTRNTDWADIFSSAWIDRSPGLICTSTVVLGFYTSSSCSGFEINDGTQKNAFNDQLGLRIGNTTARKYLCIAGVNFVGRNFISIRNGIKRSDIPVGGNPALFNRATIGRGLQYYTMTGTIGRIVYLPKYANENSSVETGALL